MLYATKHCGKKDKHILFLVLGDGSKGRVQVNELRGEPKERRRRM